MTLRARRPGAAARTEAPEPAHGPDAARALHDRMESAVLAVARSSPRFVEHVVPGGRCIGFHGLDATPMNRVIPEAVHAPADVQRLLKAAGEHFAARGVAWSVHVTTPLLTPVLANALANAGYRPDAHLAVMTREGPPVAARAVARDVRVRDAAPDEVGTFTSLVLDAFGMPTRYFKPLADVHADWQKAGARLFLAERRGRAVGTALVASADGVSGVYSVATLRAHRGRGVASALMHAVDAAHAESGNDLLTLQVDRASLAEGFYARRGFTRQYDWTFYASTRAAAGPG